MVIIQTVCGDLRGIHQSTVCRILKKISYIIAGEIRQYIKFPSTEEEVSRVYREFYNISQFPRVIGCIDCTHVSIKSPGGNFAEVYRNRKRSFSINVQVVGGPNLEIFDIVARWPGREHDSMIFNRSTVKTRFERGTLQGFLLGDSGYPCMRYLMTPLANPGNEADVRYNTSQIKTRNTVERLFGVWKRRFPCLTRTMGNKLETVSVIIVACAVLYNIGIKIKDGYGDENDLPLQENIQDEPDINEVENMQNAAGHAVRRALIERHFI